MIKNINLLLAYTAKTNRPALALTGLVPPTIGIWEPQLSVTILKQWFTIDNMDGKVSLSARKSFFNDRLSFTLGISDIFDT